MEIDHSITGCEQSRRDQWLLQEELSEQNRALRVRDMEQLQKSHVLKTRNFQEENLMKTKTRLWSKEPKISNYRMKLIVWKTQEILRMPSQYAVTIPRSQSTCVFPPSRDPGGMLCRSLECQAATTGRQIFGIRRVYRETFLQIHERLLRHLTRKSQILGSLLYVRTHITACNEWTPNTRHNFRSEMPVRTVSQKFSRP